MTGENSSQIWKEDAALRQKHDISGLIAWVYRDEWRGPMQETLSRHTAQACLDADVELAEINNARWRRLTEQRAGNAKSVFHFDVQGTVAKSTHAGIPWLRFIRQQLGPRVHFWPFDGWEIPPGKSAIAEVYPALWSHAYPRADRTGDQHDAYSIAAWLSQANQDGSLAGFLQPDLAPQEKVIAQVEGWILGVGGSSTQWGNLATAEVKGHA